MKDNLVHVCFVIDHSGSMYGSEGDVIGGYKKIIEEQQENPVGDCLVSMYQFGSTVEKYYIGKNIKELSGLNYQLSGCTALYDAVGTAIDEVGEWLSAMPEEERPSANLIVIMTDGEENVSRRYSGSKVREMIQHQESKYSWKFMYLGADISNAKDAIDMGISNYAATTKLNMGRQYDTVNSVLSATRCAKAIDAVATMDYCMTSSLADLNTEYSKETGIDLTNANLTVHTNGAKSL